MARELRGSIHYSIMYISYNLCDMCVEHAVQGMQQHSVFLGVLSVFRVCEINGKSKPHMVHASKPPETKRTQRNRTYLTHLRKGSIIHYTDTQNTHSRPPISSASHANCGQIVVQSTRTRNSHLIMCGLWRMR